MITDQEKSREEFQKDFFETYKDIPPSILAMMWVDIEDQQIALLQEVKKEIENLKTKKFEHINFTDMYRETYEEALYDLTQKLDDSITNYK